MNRRKFLTGAAALPIGAHTVLGTPPASAAVAPTHLGPSSSSATAQPMMDRFHLTMDRVLHGTGPAYTPEFLLEDIRATPGRRFTEFSGDVSGRWIGAMSTAARVYGVAKPHLEEVVQRTIALQHPEGYFGKTFHFDRPDDNDLALLWGNGRLLIGLMEYYQFKKDPAVLASARKLGDFLLRLGPSFNSKKMADEFGASHFASSYICWTQQTEGLAALYAATKDARYRDLCADISKRMERRPADHVHGYLCSLRGTVDLYNATGDKAHLRRVEAAWGDIMNSGDLLITGGVPEAWSPKKKRTEGCAEADWLRLNLALYEATGEAKYLDMAEHTIFNEFAMNQFATGDFGHAMLTEGGVPSIVYVRAWWCCTLHGLRAFPDIHQRVFRASGSAISYDLPFDGRIETPTFAASATSRLAHDGTITIRVRRAAPGQIIVIRQPKWASKVRVAVNGRAVQGGSTPMLKAGDVVTAKYSMALNGTQFGNAAKRRSTEKTFAYGPWLLGASSSGNPGYFNELHPENTLLADTASPSVEKASSPFAVPVAATRVAFQPAEFPKQPSHVVLRAVAEQTAILPTQWQILFRTKVDA